MLRAALTAIALASIAIPLAGCEPSDPNAPQGLPEDFRLTLPDAPADLKACFRREFPDIPDRVLTKRDVVRIVGEAKLLDRAKSACGDRATAWIESVRTSFGR